MDQTQPATDGAEGRLVYLVENLATLHAATGMPWIAGRFEFLGEKALGATLSVLALPDETGAYRAVASAAPRVAAVRALWDELGIDDLPTNTSAAAIFGEVEGRSRSVRHAVSELFPDSAHKGTEEALVAPIAFSRELIGVGLFVVEPEETTEAIATILASHTAVAIHQLRERDDARRLHSMDPRLWVPDEAFLLAQLTREVARSRRYGRELGIALLRFENEPAVRAQFGDFYTNHLMRRIGSQLLAKLRDTDVVGALGGGYAVIHTETSLAGTQLSSERLRDSVLQMVAQRFPEVANPEMSMRTAAYPESGSTVEDIVKVLQPESGEASSQAAA